MKTIAVTSGKGGVGKTTLSANLGVAMAKAGGRAIVFDADLALSNVELLMGVRPVHSLLDVVNGACTLQEAVTPGPAGVGFIAGGSGVPTLMRSGPKRLETFLSQVEGLGSANDVLIYDTSAGLDTKVLAFLKAADEVLLVVTPEPASVMDAYATAKTVYRHKPEASVSVLTNMVSCEMEAYAVFRALNQIANQFLGRSLDFAGLVHRDESALLASRNRKLFVLESPGCSASHDVFELANRWSKAESSVRMAA